MSIDTQEITREIKTLQEKAEKYDNIKLFFDEKSELINQKIVEIQQILNEINPSIILESQQKSRRSYGKLNDYVSKTIEYLRENKHEEITLRFILEKICNVSYSGGTAVNLRDRLQQVPNIKLFKRDNKSFLIKYQENNNLPDIKLSEKIKNEELGDISDDYDDLGKILPKKFSYMK